MTPSQKQTQATKLDPKPGPSTTPSGDKLIYDSVKPDKQRLWVGRHKNFQIQLVNIEASSEEKALAILRKWVHKDPKRGIPIDIKPFVTVDESILAE